MQIVQNCPLSVESLFIECCNLFIQRKEDYHFYLKSNLIRLLTLCHQKLSSSLHLKAEHRSLSVNMPKVIAVKEYIDKNISKTFTLAELAEVADVSPSFISRIFHHLTGEPLFTYINKSKIALAKKLLIETNNSVKQVSFACGFENVSYFHTLFKKIEGISPADYRALYRII